MIYCCLVLLCFTVFTCTLYGFELFVVLVQFYVWRVWFGTVCCVGSVLRVGCMIWNCFLCWFSSVFYVYDLELFVVLVQFCVLRVLFRTNC